MSERCSHWLEVSLVWVLLSILSIQRGSAEPYITLCGKPLGNVFLYCSSSHDMKWKMKQEWKREDRDAKGPNTTTATTYHGDRWSREPRGDAGELTKEGAAGEDWSRGTWDSSGRSAAKDKDRRIGRGEMFGRDAIWSEVRDGASRHQYCRENLGASQSCSSRACGEDTRDKIISSWQEESHVRKGHSTEQRCISGEDIEEALGKKNSLWYEKRHGDEHREEALVEKNFSWDEKRHRKSNGVMQPQRAAGRENVGTVASPDETARVRYGDGRNVHMRDVRPLEPKYEPNANDAHGARNGSHWNSRETQRSCGPNVCDFGISSRHAN